MAGTWEVRGAVENSMKTKIISDWIQEQSYYCLDGVQDSRKRGEGQCCDLVTGGAENARRNHCSAGPSLEACRSRSKPFPRLVSLGRPRCPSDLIVRSLPGRAGRPPFWGSRRLLLYPQPIGARWEASPPPQTFQWVLGGAVQTPKSTPGPALPGLQNEIRGSNVP